MGPDINMHLLVTGCDMYHSGCGFEKLFKVLSFLCIWLYMYFHGLFVLELVVILSGEIVMITVHVDCIK